MAYQLITIRQRLEWTAYVQRSIHHDFHHTWSYHSLGEDTHPFLFVFEEQDIFIALPLLKRTIEGTDWSDLTSVYGYTGPISNRDFEALDEALTDQFRRSFLDFMKDGKYVCVFSRLQPFLDQPRLLEKIGGLRDNGQTVYIDLRIPIEMQRLKYEKRLARKIRQLRNKDFQIREADSASDIKAFTAMYLDNMERNGASSRYLYDEAYFKRLLNTTEPDCRLIMVYDGATPICGNIIMYTKHVIRNHLSATAATYTQLSPSKLIIDEISIIARKLGISYYHLGGGLNGKPDSLFQFKSAFSDLILDDKTWCFIADQERYQQLVDARMAATESAFFPQYRALNS
jgi:hypothetical protein